MRSPWKMGVRIGLHCNGPLRAWQECRSAVHFPDCNRQEMANAQQRLGDLERDQDRLRKNLKEMPPEAAAYKRYLKKFDDQETEIEKRRSTITTLQASAADQRKAYESFILNLNVE